MKVELTKAQCENVAEFIEMYLFHAIREDVDIDSIYWLRSMIAAMDELRKAVNEYEGNT